MLVFKHGTGISMKSKEEFLEQENNEQVINDFITLAEKIEELSNFIENDETNDIENNSNFIISVKDELLFRKIEQIINSFEDISIIVHATNIYIKVSEYHYNENPTSKKFPNYLKLFWFIKNSLVRELYVYSLKSYHKTSNNVISFGKIEFLPKDLEKKIKIIEKYKISF